ILTKVMDQSNTFLPVKGLGLSLLLMTRLETSIQPKLLIDGQTSHLSLNLSLLSKYKISMTMHPNLQMDHILLLCQRSKESLRPPQPYRQASHRI
uniref:Uncharacterized protein n=1 Tax=Laticauda laticaudata TaxID=8630 RepID=A0A8C5SB02_LATLA